MCKMALKLACPTMKDCLWKTKNYANVRKTDLTWFMKDWLQTSVTAHSLIAPKSMETFSVLKCELWCREREVARRRATPRLRVGLSGLVAWEMRYKHEWFNIIILFIDAHSKYTLLYIIVQGGPAGFNHKGKILVNHPVTFFYPVPNVVTISEIYCTDLNCRAGPRLRELAPHG